MNPERELLELRALIPEYTCKKGCSFCCGPLAISQVERDRFVKHGFALPVVCPHVTPDGCAVYDERPLVCRLFGVVEELRCPLSGVPERMLSKLEVHHIMERYSRLLEQKE